LVKLIKWTAIGWLVWCGWLVFRDNVWATYKPG
jgi:hypothetical protein